VKWVLEAVGGAGKSANFKSSSFRGNLMSLV
jgi:hypothetical protein